MEMDQEGADRVLVWLAHACPQRVVSFNDVVPARAPNACRSHLPDPSLREMVSRGTRNVRYHEPEMVSRGTGNMTRERRGKAMAAKKGREGEV